MYGKAPLKIYLCVLVLSLIGLAPIDAAKVTRQKTKSHVANPDHVRLTHAVSSHSQPHQRASSHSYGHQQQQHRVQQSHVPQTHASAPALPTQTHASAPSLPNANANNANIGWNVGHSDTAQRQTVSNNNAGFQQSHAPIAPPQAAPAPAPYSPYAHNTNAGSQPPYPVNPNLNQQNSGFQSSYPGQGHVGGQNYPGAYPQQPPQAPFNANAGGSYPIQQQPSYIPAAGQQPVVNNFYHEQPKSSGGGSLLQTAAIGGLSGLGGAALYDALKPSEEKTIIIHEGGNAQAAPTAAPVPAAPAAAVAQPAIPAAPLPQPAAIPAAPLPQPAAIPAEHPATVPLAAPIDSSIQPQAPASIPVMSQPAAPGVFVTPVPANDGTTGVPLAPLPQEHQQLVPLAPMPDSTAIPMVPLPPQNVSVIPEITTTRQWSPEPSTNVPLAPLPSTPAPYDASHAPLKGTASGKILFHITFYALISVILAKLI